MSPKRLHSPLLLLPKGDYDQYVRDRGDPEKLKEALGVYLRDPDIPEPQKEFLKGIFWHTQNRIVEPLRPAAEQTAAKLVHIRKIYDLFTHPSNAVRGGQTRRFCFWQLSSLFHLPDDELAAMSSDVDDINAYLDDCVQLVQQLLRGHVQLPPSVKPAGPCNVTHKRSERYTIDDYVFRRDGFRCVITYRKDGIKAYPIIPYGINADTDARAALQHRWPRVERLLGQKVAEALSESLLHDEDGMEHAWNHITVTATIADALDKGILGLEPLDDFDDYGDNWVPDPDPSTIQVRAHWLIVPRPVDSPIYNEGLQRPDEDAVNTMFQPLEDSYNDAPRREVNVQTGQLVLSDNLYTLGVLPEFGGKPRMLAALKWRWQLQMVQFCAGAVGIPTDAMEPYGYIYP